MIPQKITTVAEALSLVPEFWPLVPGVDKWREGDEYFSKHEGWLFVHHMNYKILCEIGAIVRHEAARRPVPKSVREAEAYLYLKETVRPEYMTAAINATSNEALQLTRKTRRPLLDWVAEMRGNQ